MRKLTIGVFFVIALLLALSIIMVAQAAKTFDPKEQTIYIESGK